MEAHDLDEGADVRERQPHDRAHEGATRVGIAQRIERERMKRNARLGHEPTLESATTTDEEQPQLRIARAQGLDDREERAQVTARPAADEEHAARSPGCGGRKGSRRPRVQRLAGYPRR